MDEDRTSVLPVIRWNVTAAVMAGALACAYAPAFAPTGATMIAIEEMDSGDLPAEFDIWRTGEGGPARWAVMADATATSGKVIEQTSTETTNYRFPLAIYKPITTRNVDVTLRFKAVGGNVDRAGGIAVRLTDPNNYYVVRANALEDNVRFYRMVKGQREQIEGADIKVTIEPMAFARPSRRRRRFTITFDGKPALHGDRPQHSRTPARVALWTKADSVTRFDPIADQNAAVTRSRSFQSFGGQHRRADHEH